MGWANCYADLCASLCCGDYGLCQTFNTLPCNLSSSYYY